MKIIKYIILGILICFTIEVVGQIKMDLYITATNDEGKLYINMKQWLN